MRVSFLIQLKLGLFVALKECNYEKYTINAVQFGKTTKWRQETVNKRLVIEMSNKKIGARMK